VAVCGSLLALFIAALLSINGDCRGVDCQLASSAVPFQVSGAVIQWILVAFAAVSMCAGCIGCLSDEEANLERAAQRALNQHGVVGNAGAYGQMPEGAVLVPVPRY
jgi:hypothetical protein